MMPLNALLASLVLGVALADTVPGSSPAWGLVTGERKLAPIDDCLSVVQGEGLYLVQPGVAQLTFQGTSVTVTGGGGVASFSLDDTQNVTSKDTGGDECTQLVQWTGLDASAKHVLRVEALEDNRAIAIALVDVDGAILTSAPPPSSTSEPPSGSTPPPTACTTNPPPPSTTLPGASGSPPSGSQSTAHGGSLPSGSQSPGGSAIPPPSSSPSTTPPNNAANLRIVPTATVLLLAILSALSIWE